MYCIRVCIYFTCHRASLYINSYLYTVVDSQNIYIIFYWLIQYSYLSSLRYFHKSLVSVCLPRGADKAAPCYIRSVASARSANIPGNIF